jgi:hypothetical protein
MSTDEHRSAESPAVLQTSAWLSMRRTQQVVEFPSSSLRCRQCENDPSHIGLVGPENVDHAGLPIAGLERGHCSIGRIEPYSGLTTGSGASSFHGTSLAQLKQ